MAVWRNRIKIKDLLTGDASNEEARRIGKEISARIATSGILPQFDFAHRFNRVRSTNGINDLLSHFYDICDYERIWVE